MDESRQFAELGMVVHGFLAALHLVSFAYHLRRHHWLDLAVHGGAIVYDAWAVERHLRDFHDAH